MKNGKKIVTFIIIVVLLLYSTSLLKNLKNQNETIEGLINLSSISDNEMDNYLEGIAYLDKEDNKENVLIVISKDGIKNDYGAKKIVTAPNNQYLLQYENEKERKGALEKLKKDNSILSVEENVVYKTEDVNYNSWGIEKMSLDYAITSFPVENLKDVTVAIIDTGCDMSLFNRYYSGRIVEFYNVLKDSSKDMADEDGHGTHIAGTIAEGTPYNVKILPIKVSTDGRMYNTDIVAAINYIVYNKKADVINMSFGSYHESLSIKQAIAAANKKNIISVAAAGNDNTSDKHYPSAFADTIAIASINSELEKSDFSNYGAEVTFVAPGTKIKSIMSKDAYIARKNGNNDDDDHEIISGTSMATPHAVSAIAILKSYNKNLTFADVIDLLKQNTIDLGEKGWDQYYGYGLISFKDVQFCDNTYCDDYGVYKNLSKSITKIELLEQKFTQYNYYSITNLMSSKLKVFYSDGTSEEKALGDLPNPDILNYNSTQSGKQTITIKIGNISTTAEITNPTNFESGWEYNVLSDGKIEITGYKNHGLKIERLYIPEMIDSKQVKSFAENVKFKDFGVDFDSYAYLYLPSTFTRIGSYSLSGTKFKYVYGSSRIEVGAHAFESSSIVLIDPEIIKIEDYAFKDCYELDSINVWEEQYASIGNLLSIGKYAFYNCKKLASIKMTNESGYNIIGNIGEYAFYNCVSLAYFDLEPGADIGEYAFYNTFMLYDIDLYNSDSIGKYAFYESGITEVSFSTSFDIINEHAFEKCKNLKKVKFDGSRIESKAFYNSGVETISIARPTYIAEDAFAYSPIKNGYGVDGSNTKYSLVSSLGIVENATNKLIVGFTSAIGVSNTNIPDYITEIGDYAFTGNNALYKIKIPENVTKIGKYSFKDCYQLSDVYLFGNSISFGNDSFKRTHEGEVKDKELYIYIHRENTSSLKQEIVNKNLDYRYIEPDEIVIVDDKKDYDVLSKVDLNSISVKLIYHEKEDREEILSPEHGVSRTLFGGSSIGYYIQYQTSYNFQYGDTYYEVYAINSLGYESSKKVTVNVLKLLPEYTVPTGLTGNVGQKLSEIELPKGFEWMNPDGVIKSEVKIYKAKYIPNDTNNYRVVEDIDVSIEILGDSVDVESISLNKSSLTLEKGNSEKLSITIKPVTATNKTVTWKSSNDKVATVVNGKVTAVGVGTATITATSSNGKEVTCEVTVTKPAQKVAYTTHVQDIGWQSYVRDGAMAGTSHQSKRLEGIKIKVENQDYEGDIEYRTHIQDIGWEKDFKKNDEMSGTSHQSKRLEAIEIRLTGEMAEHYDVYYRVHAQDAGWMAWAKNGEQAGTSGYSRRLEGIEIVLVEKGKNPPTRIDTRTNKAFVKKQITYATHVQDYGWQDGVSDGTMSGTSHQSKRLEGIVIVLNKPEVSGNVEYRTHIQDIGWEKEFKKNGEMSGTSHQSKRLEAIEIKLTGEMAEKYDIYYRVHAQEFGWMGWAKNGESAGTAHYSYRLEAIEIVLVEKGENPPERTDTKTTKSFVDRKA